MAYKAGETEASADIYFANLTSVLSVMKTALYLVETIVSDLFIVRLLISLGKPSHILISHQLYRCYVVWNASIPIIILPTLLYIADVGTHTPTPSGRWHHLLTCVM